MAIIPLDVSDLEPCEPLERSTNAARRLDKGDLLQIIHRRDPQLLYLILEQLGLRWRTRQVASDRFEVLVGHAGDPQTDGWEYPPAS